MSGGGSKSQTTTTEPWAEQKPYLVKGFNRAEDLYNQGGSSYYPGKTLADQSPFSTYAQNQTINRAMNGSPLNQAADDLFLKTAQGGFLNNNPYLDATFNRGADAVKARVGSQFGLSGRYGSGLYQDAYQKNLNDLANQVYGGNYQQERDRMMQAGAALPGLANQDYYDFGQLANIGQQQQARSQDVINADIAKWNFDQNRGKQNVADYLAMIQGNYGGTQSTPMHSNPVGGLLGGAATGAAIGSVVPGLGTAVGAGLGGGLGLLGGFI